jgi:hypothetical protein
MLQLSTIIPDSEGPEEPITEYFARQRQADNEMKLAEIFNHVRLESGLVRRRDAGAQVPSLNGRLSGAYLDGISKKAQRTLKFHKEKLQRRHQMRKTYQTCADHDFVDCPSGSTVSDSGDG